MFLFFCIFAVVMKTIFHKIAALQMAIVVLFSTMSFAIDMHYCGDVLVETAIFHKADGCGMEMEATTPKDCTIKEKNCCENEQLVVDGQDDLQLLVDTTSFNNPLFLVSFVYTYHNLFKDEVDTHSTYVTYISPLVVKDIFKLDETYLI